MALTIRKIEARDEPRWRTLFDSYTRFYEREPVEAITLHAWVRIMEGARDPAKPVHAIVADDAERGVIGIANYILHDNISALAPVCYLQDLFVEPGLRAHGVGEQLIDWLVAEMQSQGWARLYWNTKENNYRARGLYDKYTPRDPFVRYVIPRKAD